MTKKTLNFIGIAFVALFLQLTLSRWLSIQEIKPDFLVIAIIIIAQTEGVLAGEIFGFIIGLIADGIGLSVLFGLSAFSKTIVGFLGGFLENKKSSLNPFYYYFIIITIILIHYIILYTIYYNTGQMSLQIKMLRYVLPSTIYTSIFYILLDNIIPIRR